MREILVHQAPSQLTICRSLTRKFPVRDNECCMVSAVKPIFFEIWHLGNIRASKPFLHRFCSMYRQKLILIINKLQLTNIHNISIFLLYNCFKPVEKMAERHNEVKRMIHNRLVETGEKERLKEHLQERLSECGWKDNMKVS